MQMRKFPRHVEGTLRHRDGEIFESPSGAARGVTGSSVNGWSFWKLDTAGNRGLNSLFNDYVDQTAADVDEDASEDDGDDEDDDA
jgi:hypothetical protein